MLIQMCPQAKVILKLMYVSKLGRRGRGRGGRRPEDMKATRLTWIASSPGSSSSIRGPSSCSFERFDGGRDVERAAPLDLVDLPSEG